MDYNVEKIRRFEEGVRALQAAMRALSERRMEAIDKRQQKQLALQQWEGPGWREFKDTPEGKREGERRKQAVADALTEIQQIDEQIADITNRLGGRQLLLARTREYLRSHTPAVFGVGNKIVPPGEGARNPPRLLTDHSGGWRS